MVSSSLCHSSISNMVASISTTSKELCESSTVKRWQMNACECEWGLGKMKINHAPYPPTAHLLDTPKSQVGQGPRTTSSSDLRSSLFIENPFNTEDIQHDNSKERENLYWWYSRRSRTWPIQPGGQDPFLHYVRHRHNPFAWRFNSLTSFVRFNWSARYFFFLQCKMVQSY